MRDTIDIQSNDNALFVTGQCNNHCLMCCQPPVRKNDIDFFYEKNIRLIDSAPIELPTIGITGGEPTLLGERLFDLIAYIRKRLPNTHIQILSNGRRFADGAYAERLAQVAEGMIIVGVPFHSDSPIIHDRIAGAQDAYNQTLLGLYNLAANDIDIEPHRSDKAELPTLATDGTFHIKEPCLCFNRRVHGNGGHWLYYQEPRPCLD